MTPQKKGWGFPLNSRKAHYFIDGISLCRSWMFFGLADDTNHDSADNCLTCKRLLLKVKPQAQDSANEKPEPVPAPTPCRQLRLLCLLDEASTADRSKPVATMQPMPPRPRINGRWPSACRAPFVLRDTQARRPSASVLVRCERHRQANAFCASSRAVRAGGVIA